VRAARLVPVVRLAVVFGVGLAFLGSGCSSGSGGNDSTSSKEEVFPAEDPRSGGRTPAEQKAELARRAVSSVPAKDDLKKKKPQQNPKGTPQGR
jgi:hypothetical protein